MTNFGVWCCVSGGVTGHRTAWLKRNGVLAVFPDRTSAASEASDLNERMNHPRARAAFHYEARPLPEIVDVCAKHTAEKWPA